MGSRWCLIVVFNESCTPLLLSKSLWRFIFLSGWNASSVFIVRKCETLYSKLKFLGLRKFDRSWSWSLMKRFKETKVGMLPGLRLARIRRYQSWSLSAEIFSVMHVQKDNRRKCSLLVLVKVLPRSNDRFSQFPDIQTCLRIPKGKKKKREVSHFESPTTVLQSISSGYRLQAPGSSQVKCGHVLIIKYVERGWSKSLRLIITYWKDEWGVSCYVKSQVTGVSNWPVWVLKVARKCEGDTAGHWLVKPPRSPGTDCKH